MTSHGRPASEMFLQIFRTFDYAFTKINLENPANVKIIVDHVLSNFRKVNECRDSLLQCDKSHSSDLRGLLSWLLRQTIRILSDDSLASTHKTLMYGYSRFLIDFLPHSPDFMNQIVWTFENLTEFGERTCQEGYGEDYILYLREDKDNRIPSHLTNDIVKINGNSRVNMSRCYSFFTILIKHNVTLIEKTGKSFVFHILQILCRQSRLSDIQTSVNAMTVISELTHFVNPSNSMEWEIVASCVELFASNFRTGTTAMRIFVMDRLKAMTKSLLNKFDSNDNVACRALFTAAIDILLCFQTSNKVGERVEEVPEWVELAVTLVDFLNLNSDECRVAALFIHSYSQPFLPLISACLKVNLKYELLQLDKSLETNDVSASKSSSTEITPMTQTKIDCLVLSEIWRKCISVVELNFHSSSQHSNVVGLAAEFIEMGLNVQHELSLEFKRYDLNLFDAVENRLLTNIERIGLKYLKTPTESKLEAFGRLTSAALVIADDTTFAPVEFVLNLFLFPWVSEQDMSDETRSVCLEGIANLIGQPGEMLTVAHQMALLDLIGHIVEYKSRDSILIPRALKLLMFLHLKSQNEELRIKSIDLLCKSLDLRLQHFLGCEELGSVLLCFLSGKTTISRRGSAWKLVCSECDLSMKLPETSKPILTAYNNLVCLYYAETIAEQTGSVKKAMSSYLARYAAHAHVMKSRQIMTKIVNAVLHSREGEKSELMNHLCSFVEKCSSGNHGLAEEIVAIVAQKMQTDTSELCLTSAFSLLVTMFKKLPLENLLLPVVRIFLVHFLNDTTDEDVLRLAMQTILTPYDCDVKKLLIRYEPEIGHLIADLIVHNLTTKNLTVNTTVTRVARFFDSKIDTLLNETLLSAHLVFSLMCKCKEDHACFLLKELSASLQIEIKDFLTSCFPDVFVEIYFLEDIELKQKCLFLLLKQLNCTLDALIYCSYGKVIASVIINARNPFKVVRLLRLVSNKTEDSANWEEMADLKLHFIGSLTIIDIKLNSGSSSYFAVKNILTSLCTFMEILGSDIITSIRAKLLATLRTSLPRYYKTMPRHCLMVWLNFCYCVNLTSLGPYLTTLFISMLPLLDIFPGDVSTIFYYFVVENGAHFREYIPELYFVPDHSDKKMHTVWRAIQATINHPEPFQTKINRTLSHVDCDSMEARIYALKHLHKQLVQYSAELLDLFSKSGTSDHIFENVIDCVLSNMHYSNPDIKVICATCLGEIGAIDPARFKTNTLQLPSVKNKYNVMGEEFLFLCVSKMVRCLSNYEDGHVTIKIYCSIQELLSIYFKSKEDSDPKKFFDQFPISERDLLEPLLQTQYAFTRPVIKKKTKRTIYFGSHTTKTPCEWASCWATELLSYIPDTPVRRAFETCLPVMFIDLSVVEALLPFILMHCLLLSDKNHIDIVEKEMKSILHWDTARDRSKLPAAMDIMKRAAEEMVHTDVSQSKYLAIILDLLDFLQQALVDIENGADLGLPEEITRRPERIRSFLSKFPPMALSWKSYIQNDYYRSLFYLEKDFADKTISEANLKPLKNIYLKLNDTDGLLAVTRNTNEVCSTEDSITDHIVCGNIQEALSGYEKMAKTLNSTSIYRGLIQCYLNINQPYSALSVSKSLIQEGIYLQPSLFNEHLDALLSNYSFDEYDTALSGLPPTMTHNWSWTVDSTMTLNHLKNLDFDLASQKIASIKCNLIDCLSSLSCKDFSVYSHGFSNIVKLHILNEIETVSSVIKTVDLTVQAPQDNGLKSLSLRTQLLPSSGPHLRDIFKTRIQILSMAERLIGSTSSKQEPLTVELGRLWLESAKIARKNGNLQSAYTNIGFAEKFDPPGLLIERAKYHKAKLETDSAIMLLNKGLSHNFPDRNQLDSNKLLLYAKAKLLIAEYDTGNVNVDFAEGMESFKVAAEVCHLEKSFVRLAQYMYMQHTSESEPDNTALKRKVQFDAAQNFSKSLLYGCKYIYQSMPCLLSLWLDYGARLEKNPSGQRNDHVQIMKDFTKLMRNNTQRLPTYMFMTAFSQILSRINHRNEECLLILKEIIFNILKDYPHQAMWSFISVWKTPNSMQRKRAEEICRKLRSSGEPLASFIKIFFTLVNKLIDIAELDVKNVRSTTSLRIISPNLRDLLKSNVQVMVPLQNLRTATVPNYKFFNETARMQHDPFPASLVYFYDVQETVEVMFSLQKPKKLTFIGSDGKEYSLLCKTDDLRLDARIMEFNSIINLYLSRDPISRERNLSIRTYSVVPLNVKCGIIEWISNLKTFKSILMGMYGKLKMKTMSATKIRDLFAKEEMTAQQRLDTFQLLLKNFPPVFHKWFFDTFPRADVWYFARQSYVKTAAVMSIVGYIVGLGDRHCDNILFDTLTGELIHVDFSIALNKGESLAVPEIVPYRLTQNMVKAMGPTSSEGSFLICCEITNRIMRRHKDQLISVIKPFLYDMDLSESSASFDSPANKMAQQINNVERRLQGEVRLGAKGTIRLTKALSVEGQTRRLMTEATSHANLSKMFHGWAAYL